MKIRITFDLDEFTRRAIAHRTGEGDKPADYETCKNTLRDIVEGELEAYTYDLDRAEARQFDNDSVELPPGVIVDGRLVPMVEAKGAGDE